GAAVWVHRVYRGGSLPETGVRPLGTTRLRIGIHPETFAWPLQPGMTFATPEAIVAWSGDGIGGVSDARRGLYLSRRARGPWRDRPRPVLLSSWEGVYMRFDEPTILEMA